MRSLFVTSSVTIAALATAGLVVLAVACGGSSSGSGCTQVACTGGSTLSYQTCGTSGGATLYKLGAQSCTCPAGPDTPCSACAAAAFEFCQGVLPVDASDDGSGSGSSSSGSTSSSSGGNGSSGTGGSSGGSGSGGSSGSASGGGSGSSSSSGGGSDGGLPACVVELSGAAKGAFPCTASLLYDSRTTLSSLSVTVLDPRPLQSVQVLISSPGMPVAGMSTNQDPNLTASLGVVGASTSTSISPAWSASSGNGSSTGTFALTLNPGKGLPSTTGVLYGATGSLSATLPAVASSGATGDVTLSATF